MPRDSTPYEKAADVLLRESGCTIRQYRDYLSGRAHIADDEWAITVPYPRGPVSFGIFAHEVAHQLLHRSPRKARWLEEIEAWEWALGQFDRFSLPGKDKAENRARKSLSWRMDKTLRRCSTETEVKITDRYRWVWDSRSW